MLSESDLALVLAEPRLPGLSLALDAPALAAELAARWPLARVGALEFNYVRLKPGTSCLLAGTVDVDGRPWHVHVKVLPIGSPKVRRPHDRPHAEGPEGLVPLAIDALGLAVWPFPNDAALQPLARLHQPAERVRVLSAVSALDPGAASGQLRMLAYKPERRYVAAWAPNGNPVATLRVHASAFARAAQSARLLHSRGELRLPSLIGASSRWGAVLVEWLSGRPLAELLSDQEADATELGHRVGAALAELHDATPAGLPILTVNDAVVSVEAAAAHVSWTRLDLAPRAAALARELRGLLAVNGPDRPSAIHGDFYAKQVLIDTTHVAFVDMDDAAAGDPLADVANFLAHLELDVVRGRLWEGRAREMAIAFATGYARAASSANSEGRIDVDRLDVQVAAALIRLAPRPFRDRVALWPEQTDALLTRAEGRLQDLRRRAPRPFLPCRRAPSPLDVGSHALAADPELAFLTPALDPAIATAWLNRATTTRHTRVVGVDRVRVIRHKPGRRCLVELEVQTTEGREQWLAKARAKGVDTRTPRLQDALWHSGLDGRSPFGVSVAEVIGVVPEWRLWVQRKVEGAVGLGDDRWLEARDVWPRVARALVRFHTSGLTTGRTHALAHEQAALDSRLEAISTNTPSFAADVTRLRATCTHAAESCPMPGAAACLHRDFYFDQVLVMSSRLYVVDLDTAATGDPALDAGNFIAHLIERAIRSPDLAVSLRRAADDFRAEFLAASSGVDPQAVEVYTTLALARLAAVSRGFEARRPFTGDIIRECLARGQAPRVFVSAGGAGARR